MELSMLQKQVEAYVREFDINTRVESKMLDIVSEVSELTQEMIRATGYWGQSFRETEDWQRKMGEVLFTLLCIANETGTDLEKCLMTRIHPVGPLLREQGNQDLKLVRSRKEK